MFWRTIHQVAVVLLLPALFAAAGCKSQKQSSSDSELSPEKTDDGTPYYHGLIQEYRTMLAEDPHNLAAIIALANSLYDAHQWKSAIHYYEQALNIAPHSVDVITDMGTCYRNLGMSDKAIEVYEHALSVEPGHQNALFNLGIVYSQDKKDYRKAIGVWEQLLHIAPKHPQADSIRSSLHMFRQALRKQAR